MNENYTLGVVPYLNAEPLVWPLESGDIDHSCKIIRATPAELVEMLANEEVECAIAPIVCLLENPEYVPVPDVAIACRGAVASVILFHEDPFEELNKIWLDPASETSNLLVQVLRNRFARQSCNYIIPKADEAPPVDNLPINAGRLMIGDPALRLMYAKRPPAGYTDLGELWRTHTAHPFTFARWVARNGDIAANVVELVKSARDWSLLHLHEIVEPLSEKYGFPIDLIDRYLRTNITYMYGPREQAGVREFNVHARKILKDLKEHSDDK